MNWEGVEGSGRGLVQDISPGFPWREKAQKLRGRDLNLGPPEHKSEVLRLSQRAQ
jgi:hypothetical protein